MTLDPHADARYARDRLDITNVLHSYAHHADHREYPAFLALFREEARIRIGDGPELSKAQFGQGLGAAPADGGRTRHVMSNLVVREQTGQRASGALYFVLMRTQNGKTIPAAAGQYDFVVTRESGDWRITDWRCAIDA